MNPLKSVKTARSVARVSQKRHLALQCSRRLTGEGEAFNGSLALRKKKAPSLSPSLHCQPTVKVQPVFRRFATTEAPNASLKRTALYHIHAEHGGKMVPFGGFSMPVQYSDLGVGESHQWTREKASLFDVGHMVQHRLTGPGATTLLERITPTSVTALENYHSTLSCLLHPYTGGIVDDTVITRLGPETFYLVTNAACREKDLAYLKEQISSSPDPSSIDWQVLDGWGLVALQGPLSARILQRALGGASAVDLEGHEDFDLTRLYFGQCKHFIVNIPSSEVGPAPILVSRAGYTGEDGFEISIPPPLTQAFTAYLLKDAEPEQLRLAGLGARDSLRLEAGMCLYGHDLNDDTTPVEAGLGWVVHKDRRTAGGFHGDEVVLRQLKPTKEGGTPPERRRVGIIVDGAPAREGAQILAAEDTEIVVGNVTSGCPSPTLGKNIAMGYVKNGYHKAGTEVGVQVRGKRRKGVVTKMPFVPAKYWKQTVGTTPA